MADQSATKATESGWLLTLLSVVRVGLGPEIKAASVIIEAYWEGVRRYQVSFRGPKAGRAISAFGKKIYNEQGRKPDRIKKVPDSPFNDMKAWAAAIILEKRELKIPAAQS